MAEPPETPLAPPPAKGASPEPHAESGAPAPTQLEAPASPATPPPAAFVTPPPLPASVVPPKSVSPNRLAIAKRKIKLPLILGVIAAVAIIGLLIWLLPKLVGRSKPTTTTPQTMELTMWGLFENADAVQTLTDAYHAAHPNVTIHYVKKDFATYEVDLNNAIAEGNPPDILQIRNDWLARQKDKLTPAPSSLSVTNFLSAYSPSAGFDLIWPRPLADKSGKVDQAALTGDHKLYALPWSIDTLALFYNRDLFARAGINSAPANWDGVIDAVKKTRQVVGNTLTTGGLAIGTSKNTSQAADILAALMLQNGAVMVSPNGKSALFNQGVVQPASSSPYPAGTLALDFYQSFSNPGRESYGWNASFPASDQAFAAGKAAMMLGYSYHMHTIESLAPSLSYDVAPLPQIQSSDSPLTVAEYWANAVPRNSAHAAAAWDFLAFSANHDLMQRYWQISKMPPARSDLIAELSGTPRYGAFIKQAPQAVSFYKSTDPIGWDTTFNKMIDAVITSAQPLQQSIDEAAKEATALLAQKRP